MVEQTGVTGANLRGVALAVGVVAGVVHEDSSIQLLLAESGEHKDERRIAEEGTTDHSRGFVFNVVGAVHPIPLQVYIR